MNETHCKHVGLAPVVPHWSVPLQLRFILATGWLGEELNAIQGYGGGVSADCPEAPGRSERRQRIPDTFQQELGYFCKMANSTLHGGASLEVALRVI